MKNKNINQLLRTVGKNSMLLVVALAHFVDINCSNNHKKKSTARKYPVQRNVSNVRRAAPVETSTAVVEKNSYQKEISEQPLDPTENIEPSVDVQMTQLPDGSAVETKTTVEVNEEEGKVVTTVETWTLYDYAKVAAITVGTAAALGGAGYLLYKNNGNLSAAGGEGYDQFNASLKNINAAVNSGVEKFNSGVDSAKSWWNGSAQNVPVKQVIASDSDAQSSVVANSGDADSSDNRGQVVTPEDVQKAAVNNPDAVANALGQAATDAEMNGNNKTAEKLNVLAEQVAGGEEISPADANWLTDQFNSVSNWWSGLSSETKAGVTTAFALPALYGASKTGKGQQVIQYVKNTLPKSAQAGQKELLQFQSRNVNEEAKYAAEAVKSRQMANFEAANVGHEAEKQGWNKFVSQQAANKAPLEFNKRMVDEGAAYGAKYRAIERTQGQDVGIGKLIAPQDRAPLTMAQAAQLGAAQLTAAGGIAAGANALADSDISAPVINSDFAADYN